MFFHGATCTDSGVTWRIWAPRAKRVQLILFARHRDGANVIAYLNFSDRSQELADTIVEREAAPEHLPLLSSEWPRFGGRYHDDNIPPRVAKSWRLLPFEVLVLSLPVPEFADYDECGVRPDAPNNDLV